MTHPFFPDPLGPRWIIALKGGKYSSKPKWVGNCIEMSNSYTTSINLPNSFLNTKKRLHTVKQITSPNHASNFLSQFTLSSFDLRAFGREGGRGIKI